MSAFSFDRFDGHIVLAGAGKMGGAMLSGWIAQGIDPSRLIVIEPTPSAEITALAAKGVKLNPAAHDGEIAALIVAVKPQMFTDAAPTLKPFVSSSTLVISIMAGIP